MPFRPELNYFFLFLKEYLEKKYKIRVERGDSRVLTIELLKKVSDQISEASFLIADITGNNANVFFELGIAHERNKPVILVTQDNPKDAPIDIRPFESIQYDLGKHHDFLVKLDNAVLNVLGSGLNIPQPPQANSWYIAQKAGPGGPARTRTSALPHGTYWAR
jgi:hypothetical protein